MSHRVMIAALGAAWALSCQGADPRICKDYVSRIPKTSIEQCLDAGLTDQHSRSVRGRVIWGTDVPAAGNPMRVLVLGGIHGDEMSSVSLVYHWIALARQSATPPGQAVHWRFVPSLNPDGLFFRPSRRVNAHGVDLNRNFPTPQWARESKEYWEKRTRRDPRRWPGKTALSEPESRYVVEQIQHFKPHLIVSVHAPFGVLDFDGPLTAPARLGRLYLDQVGIYPGSLGNYGGVHKGVPVVTIELPSASQLPPPGEVQQMWMDLQRWMAQRLSPVVAKSGANGVQAQAQ